MTERRTFGSARMLPSGLWQVRYSVNRQRIVGERLFADKRTANKYLSRIETDIAKGQWVDPRAGRLTFAAYADEWLEHRTDLAARTAELYRQLLDSHLLPTFGNRTLAGITVTQVRAWRAALPTKIAAKKPAIKRTVNGDVTAAKAYRLLAQIMRAAVDDGKIGRSPCRVKNGGDEPASEPQTVTLAELDVLVEAMPERYRLVPLLGCWCQLRLGEVRGLRRVHVDVLGKQLHIRETRTSFMYGGPLEKDPKSSAGLRDIAIPPHVLPLLSDHLDEFVGPSPDAYVFTGAQGAPFHPPVLYKHWRAARNKIGKPSLRLHDLRHTGLTLAAASGATIAELMHRAGHSTPTTAMHYQHATRDRDRIIADALSGLVPMAPVVPLGHLEGTGTDGGEDSPLT